MNSNIKHKMKFVQPLTKTMKNLKPTVLDAIYSCWRDYLIHRERFLNERSRSSVHALRISIRKLEALLGILKSIYPLKYENKLLKTIHRELQDLSYLRDIQVQKKEIKERSISNLRRRELRDYLDSAEKKEIKKAVRKMKTSAVIGLTKMMFKIERRLNDFLVVADENGLKKSLNRLRLDFARDMYHLERQIVDLKHSKENKFHTLRLDIKDFSYKLEILKPLIIIPAKLENKIQELKMNLGQLQDLIAFSKITKDFLRKTKSHPHPNSEMAAQIFQKRTEIIRST
ncbi:MAG: CHAD domain-containing protein [Bdellovibrionaceae bacterium]|nr:CHAD domain-containing protein [Pseudobdellovibrionaceae bacterium]